MSMEQVYWSGTISILSLGCISTIATLVVLWNYQRKVKQIPLLIQAYAALVVGDVFMWGNFLPRDINHLWMGHVDDGTWCKVSAVWTISCVFSINGLCMCIAYCTYLVCHKMFVLHQNSVVLYWSLGSWSIGFVLALLYAFYDLLGPYKGLYCCIRLSSYSNFSVLPLFVIFAVSICLMSYWYIRASQLAYALEENNRNSKVRRTPNGRQQSPRSSATEHDCQRASIRVMKQGIILVGTFYIGWFPISFIGLLQFFNVVIPVEFDILAGWVAKSSVLFNSAFIILSVAKVARKQRCSSLGKEKPSSQSSTLSGSSRAISTLQNLLRLTRGNQQTTLGFHPNHVWRAADASNEDIASAPPTPRYLTGNPMLSNYTEEQLLMFAVRNTKARKIFLRYCVKEFSVENLKFLVAYQHLLEYTKTSNLKDPTVAQTCVLLIQDIYRMYLAKNAPLEVNISYKAKCAVRDSYQSHFKGGVNMSSIDAESTKALRVFQLAFSEVHELVLSHSWPRFVNSDLYEEFLKQARRAEKRRLSESREQELKNPDMEASEVKNNKGKTDIVKSLMFFLRSDIQNAGDLDNMSDLQSGGGPADRSPRMSVSVPDTPTVDDATDRHPRISVSVSDTYSADDLTDRSPSVRVIVSMPSEVFQFDAHINTPPPSDNPITVRDESPMG